MGCHSNVVCCTHLKEIGILLCASFFVDMAQRRVGTPLARILLGVIRGRNSTCDVSIPEIRDVRIVKHIIRIRALDYSVFE